MPLSLVNSVKMIGFGGKKDCTRFHEMESGYVT